MSNTTQSVAVAWHGLPAYAARLIRQAGGDFPVIATRPVVPVEGMDELLPGRIHWIDDHFAGGWRGLKLEVPRLYFQPSWNTPAFNQLGDEVRRAGGKVVVMFDNPWKGSLRQWLGAVRFRTQWHNRFCSAWVCGKLGHRLARFWGFRAKQIFQGMYGADPDVFGESSRITLASRPRRFLFVGRLVDEKGVLDLFRAWKDFAAQEPDWELHIYGTGPRETEARTAGAKMVYHGFQQPAVIAQAMQSARFLVLPSHDEHWGLVVCEAAQAGCGLLLSSNVGSGPDLLSSKNGRFFPARDSECLRECLIWATCRSVDELGQIEQESLLLGHAFTPQSWARTFHAIARQV